MLRVWTRGIWWLRLWLAACVALTLPGLLAADRLFLTNGQVVEGRISFEDGAEVHIVVGGSEVVFGRERISRIERVDAAEQGPGEAEATASRLALRNRDVEGAWEALLRMDAADAQAWRRHESHVKSVATRLTETMDQAIEQGRADAALSVASLLARDESLALLLKVYPDTRTSIENRLRLGRGNAHTIAGRAARQDGRPDDAERELRRAAELLRPEDPFYARMQFEIGMVLKDKGARQIQAGQRREAEATLTQAVQALDQVRQTARSDANMLQLSISEIQIVRDTMLTPLRAELRITPTPTPIVIVRTATPTPTPAPTPTPEPGLTERLFGSDLKEKLSGMLGGILPQGVDGGDVADWIAYALLFIVGFWVVPWGILKLLARRMDFVAQQWLDRVKFLGPIALIGYIVAFIKLPERKERKKKVRHPCPHCGFPLDNPLHYEKLDFAHCPNCGGDIAPIYSIDDYIQMLSTNLATDAEKVVLGHVTMESFVGKDMMQRLVRAFVSKAIRNRASDVHVEPQHDHVMVRFRIDGMMLEMARLPASLGPAVVSAVKVAADMDISEKRKPQDGRTQFDVDGTSIDVRVASSPSPSGEKLSMRLLDFRSVEMDPKKLGMTKSTRELFERAIREPHGLILVCGPTGSGKTTTLYVALRMLATGDKNIVSIEDPIEFRLPGINQSQVNPAAGLTFANGLRSILRQDPDVVMVGEIRDKETAEIAVNAAQTGHLVFSTLHTIDAASSVTRLLDFGIGPRQFADALSLVMAQRLVRLVCPECRKPSKADTDLLKSLGVPEMDISDFPCMVGPGCDLCNKTGFHGRTGLFEMLVPNTEIRGALERGNLTTAELRELAISNGMRTLREEALVLLRQGMTSAEEVLRVTK
ncbi:MAG: Flp pilus assembly complex ATPase component TadA [Candidatus Sumerlaeia bacterium]|nr:Flp pilus assembly complex ATPase component TadA [Candidatus Sumerlaeia bacterium]